MLNFPNSNNYRHDKKLYISAFQKYLNCVYTSDIFRFIQRTCEVNTILENSSFIFKCFLKTVPVYDFKLAWEVLHPPVLTRAK